MLFRFSCLPEKNYIKRNLARARAKTQLSSVWSATERALARASPSSDRANMSHDMFAPGLDVRRDAEEAAAAEAVATRAVEHALKKVRFVRWSREALGL